MAYLDPRTSASTGVTSYRVKYRPIPGAPEKVATFGDPAEAERWKDLCNLIGPTEALKALPSAKPDTRLTVADLMASHIAGLSGIEPGTRHDYLRDTDRDIDPHLGSIPAADLTRKDVSWWVNELESSGLAPKTIKNRHGLLSSALNTAATHDHTIPANVAKGVRLPALTETEMVFLEHEEFRNLLSHIRPAWRPLVVTLAGTGLRWSEATALRVRDIDLARSSLRVRVSWKHSPGARRLGPAKTRAGHRTVEYGPQVTAVLEKLCAGRSLDDWVFTNMRGTPVLHGTFHTAHWRTAVKRAMSDETNPLMKEPRIHDLRHSYASWCLCGGVPIYTVSKALGHKNSGVTTDRYGHLESGRLTSAAKVADAALQLEGLMD